MAYTILHPMTRMGCHTSSVPQFPNKNPPYRSLLSGFTLYFSAIHNQVAVMLSFSVQYSFLFSILFLPYRFSWCLIRLTML